MRKRLPLGEVSWNKKVGPSAEDPGLFSGGLHGMERVMGLASSASYGRTHA